MKPEIKWAQGVLTVVVMAAAIACNLGGQGTKVPSNDFIFAGCYAPGATTGNTGCGLAATLGDSNTDAIFEAEVNNQLSFWNDVPANVHYWNDCQSPNSVSLPTGDILYGVNLFQELVTSYGGDAGPISGVLAHEWGHQVQFDNGWMSSNQPTAAPIELEADAFSGFYMALGESFSWGSINDYFAALASHGDYNFTDPNHHGTPQERLAAAQLGFQTALQVVSTGTPLSYTDLHGIFSTAIAGFVARQISSGAKNTPEAARVLVQLDSEQIFDILDGKSRGKDAVVPSTDNRRLFPRR